MHASVAAAETPGQRLEHVLRLDGLFLRERAEVRRTIRAQPALRARYAELTDSLSVHLHSGRLQVVTDFRDPSQRIEIPAAPHLDYTEAVSFSVWVWLESDEMLRDTKIVSHSGVSTGKVTLMGYRRRLVGLFATEDGSVVRCRSITEIPTRQWTHVGLAVHRDKGATLYVDGRAADLRVLSGEFRGARLRSAPRQPLYVGGLDRAFPGWLDDLRVYGRALSADEFSRLAAGHEVRDGLLGHWPLDEAEGDVAHDISPFANHGTIGAGVHRNARGRRNGCMGFGRDKASWLARLDELEEGILELRDAARVDRGDEERATVEQLRHVLTKRDAVLVYFAKDPETTNDDGVGLIAWIVDPRASQPVTEVRLALSRTWQTARAVFVRELRLAGDTSGDSEIRATARAVARELWDPIEAVVGRDREIWLRLTTELHPIPFAALIGSDGEYLVQHYAFARCGPITGVLDRQARDPRHEMSGQRMVALTNPSFGDLDNEPTGLTAQPNAAGGYRSLSETGACIVKGAALYGTRREVDAVVPLLRAAGFHEIEVHDWAQAQEHVLDRVVRDAEVVHVATHGYQIPRGCTARDPQDPLHRSGVVLAGAVRIVPDGSRGSHDGLLSAAEVAELDLSRARLVVWSGCSTATGSVLPDESLCGLAAAAWLAGAHASVATLWRVSDELMPLQIEAFYRSWVVDGNAARAVQHALRAGLRITLEDRGHAHPGFWAALVVEGL